MFDTHYHYFDKATEKRIMATLADLKASVTNLTTVTASAIALLQGISEKLAEAIAANDPAAIQALKDEIDSDVQGLADSVAANTPSA